MPQPLIPKLYLLDSNSIIWYIDTDSYSRLRATPVAGPVSTSPLPILYINDQAIGTSWAVTISTSGNFVVSATPYISTYPQQYIVTAQTGFLYAIQVTNGILQTAVPLSSYVNAYACTTPISSLGGNVQDRLEEPRGNGLFWSLNYEIYVAIAEAMNEAMMLVGSPTQTVSATLNLIPNSVWQSVPTGLFCITDIQGPSSLLRKVSLFDMDYGQASWGSDWENDTSPFGPTKWFPVGMTMFGVHPAPTQPQQVTVSGIAYPLSSSTFPPSGLETVPFQNEYHVALEMYAAHYCRIKETTQEFQESMALYTNFLNLMQRMSMITDRRDPFIFAKALGTPMGLAPIRKR